MKAVQYAQFGGPDVLRLVDVPTPVAGVGEVRIRVKAVGIGPFDVKRRSGRMPGGPLIRAPQITGVEASGVVDHVGVGVTDAEVGDDVFGIAGKGAAAEYAVLSKWAQKPPGISYEEAAGIAVAGRAALRALDTLNLSPGNVILIHGASVGAGQAATQLARTQGLRVIGTATTAHHDLLRHLGALPTDYGDGLTERVAELTPSGVQGVLDAAGTQLDDLATIAGTSGRVVTLAGEADPDGDAAAQLSELAIYLAAGDLTMRVAARFPLDKASDAHARVETGHAGGLVVLLVN